MPLLPFPEDMFKLREGETQMYGFDADIHSATEYFKSLISIEEWVDRRSRLARQFYGSLVGEPLERNAKGHFYLEDDKFGWYLFLAESINHHPQNYEPNLGAKVVPLFAAIGRNIKLIPNIDGFGDRSKRLWSDDRKQPNGTLFELLVALLYASEGRHVSFVPEQLGGPKTHDLDVRIGDLNYAVECKKMDAGEFEEGERQRMRELWSPAAKELVSTKLSSLTNITFKILLNDVPNDYLRNRATEAIKDEKFELEWNDDISSGSIKALDLSKIQTSLKKGYILYPGPVYNAILFGEHIRNDNLLLSQKVKLAPNPHFIDEVEQVVAARWRSASDASIERRARDIKRLLVRAWRQLPEDRPSILHFGIESLGGDVVEKARYDKIFNTIMTFDFQTKPVAFAYCNYFAPEATIETPWAIDETVQWHSKSAGSLPLDVGNLIVPAEAISREGTLWDGKPIETYYSPDK